MIPKSVKLWCLAVAVFFQGCYVPSVNPFYTENNLIQPLELLGAWNLAEYLGSDFSHTPIKPWVIDDRLIKTFDESGREGSFEYKVFKINESLFLDVYPSDADVNEYWTAGLWRTHLLFKLNIESDRLHLSPLNYEWVDEKIKTGQLDLARVKSPENSEDEMYLYTVEPEDWERMLKEHEAEPDVFIDTAKIILKRYRQ